ncbi:MAG: hypothetical protein ACYCT2_08495 [Thermoplasmataceae archaeon]
MDKETIVEIQIRRVKQLSEVAQREVESKLANLPQNFNFRGYAKVSYAESSPLRIVRVDPIEGTINNYFNDLSRQINQNR